jgi:AcrR family transcriptional regulator
LGRANAPMAPFAPIPRGEKRRREIAAVAEMVFFESGFSDTTMHMIAARAGASKETLYRHFGSKEELFAEIVENRAKGFLDGLDEKFDRPGSVAQVLRDLGGRLLDAMVGPQALSLCRLVIAEGPRNPELGRIFFTEGPDRVRGRLTEFLRVADARGELACDDPRLAASLFLGAIMASIHLESLVLQQPPGLSVAQVKAHVEGSVSMFLARYASPA